VVCLPTFTLPKVHGRRLTWKAACPVGVWGRSQDPRNLRESRCPEAPLTERSNSTLGAGVQVAAGAPFPWPQQFPDMHCLFLRELHHTARVGVLGPLDYWREDQIRDSRLHCPGDNIRAALLVTRVHSVREPGIQGGLRLGEEICNLL